MSDDFIINHPKFIKLCRFFLIVDEGCFHPPARFISLLIGLINNAVNLGKARRGNEEISAVC